MNRKTRDMVQVWNEEGQQILTAREGWLRGVFEPALRRDWNNADALYDRVLDCMNNDLYAEMRPAAVRLHALEGWSDRTLIAYVASHSETGRFAEAEAPCRERLLRDASDPLALGLLSRICHQAGRTSESFAWLWQALEADPNHLLHAELWVVMHRHVGGEAAVEKAMKRLQALPGCWLARVWNQRDALERGEVEDSLRVYEDALQASGGSRDAVSVISGELGATGHAREMLELLLPLYDPARHGVIAGYNLMQACFETKNPAAAEELEQRLRSREEGPVTGTGFESLVLKRWAAAQSAN
jgi:tetratricopeptide (TPR) repeat protein